MTGFSLIYSSLALLLQTREDSKQPSAGTPGVEVGFSKVMIVIFIITIAVAAVGAAWMVMRGAAGVAKAEFEDKNKKS